MCTRQYLCITADRRVTLTPDAKDPRNVFRLHPVIKVTTKLINNTHNVILYYRFQNHAITISLSLSHMLSLYLLVPSYVINFGSAS